MFVSVLESRVHGPHEHAILQRREAQVEGGEKVWISGVGHGR
jgi:hypothetical protein